MIAHEERKNFLPVKLRMSKKCTFEEKNSRQFGSVKL